MTTDGVESDEYWMRVALESAQRAAAEGEVPVGAVLLDADGQLMACAHNQTVGRHDPTGHAEVLALREAGARCGNYRLPGSTLYCTIEPCTMCAGALVHARVARLVYGATEPKAGAIHSTVQALENPMLNHRVAVTAGVLATESAAILQQFFQARRGRPCR